MSEDLLTARQAARYLGISAPSLYDWLAQSNAGAFTIRGRAVTIDYLQGGPKGQGRILIEHKEVERLQNLMRVSPQPPQPRQPPCRQQTFPGITVQLGRPGV